MCDWFGLEFSVGCRQSELSDLCEMPGKVVVYGGKGGLGQEVVDTFKARGYWVLSVDILQQPSADENVLVSLAASWAEQEIQVTEGVGAALRVS